MELTHVHLKPEQIVDYFSSLWTLDQEKAIEVHLAACDSCATLARAIYLEQYVLDEWTAELHAKVTATAPAVAYR